MITKKLLILFIILIIIFINKKQIEIFTNKLRKEDIIYIHIGKTGGSTLQNYFNFRKIHTIKPQFFNNKRYIISIRNPLKLFVANINNEKKIIYALEHYYNTKKILNIPAQERLERHIKNNKKYSHTREIDQFLKKNSINQICLNIKNIDKKYLVGHTLKNISWYLDNGEFIKKYHKNIIYVTKQETLDNDINNIAKMLNIKVNLNEKKNKRKNNDKDEYLSPQAIKNLKDFFKNTEYKTLKTLYDYNFIDKEYLDYCYTYKT